MEEGGKGGEGLVESRKRVDRWRIGGKIEKE